MEIGLRKSAEGDVVKEEKRVESSGDEEGCNEETFLKVGNGRRANEDDNLKPSSPNQNGKQDNRLESTKAEMGEVREENQRLRVYLNRITKDYQALQMQFYDLVKQEAKEIQNAAHSYEETEESELVSLSLGRTSSDPRKDEKPRKGKEGQQDKEDLSLGLDCKFEMSKTGPTGTPLKPSPENSLEEKEEAGESWPPQKVRKTSRSEDEEVLQQNPPKKARVSVRVRCETPTMNDGCQWRKYGQKISKGNPCPRAYYRCTVAPSCPVRKQVQRFAEDMSILTTTYEGTHNHPLPISATSMASTTSAAASMLLSGSTSSGIGPSSSAGTTTSAADFRGLNFYLSDNSKSKQFYLHNSSISSSPCPTITLDLTSSSSPSLSHFNKNSSNFLSNPRYSSTNLNFSSLESNPLPISWSNGVLNYGTQPYNKNQVGSLNFGRQPQENFYQSFMQKSNPNPQQPLQADTIAAATKAITSDPSFQSALAAALTSIIGTSGGGGGGNLGYQLGGDKFGQNLKLGEPFPVASNFPSTAPNGNKCSSSYLNRSSSVTNSQPGSMMFLQPPLPFSKNKSTSPGDRDHII